LGKGKSTVLVNTRKRPFGSVRPNVVVDFRRRQPNFITIQLIFTLEQSQAFSCININCFLSDIFWGSSVE